MNQIMRMKVTPPSSSQGVAGSHPNGRRNEEVDNRLTSGLFLGRVFEQLEFPGWFLMGTSFENSTSVPAKITVRDYLILIGNLASNGPDPAYYIDYMAAGVPIYRGAIDMGLRNAPDLLSALEFWAEYGSDRPGFHKFFVDLDRDLVRFRIEPGTKLGAAQAPLTEMMLLGCVTMAARCKGAPVANIRVEMRHNRPDHAERLREVFHCDVDYGAELDAISFPLKICKMPSASYDEQLWQTASIQCAKEAARAKQGAVSLQVENLFEHYLADNGRIPRLYDIAAKMGMSSRTLERKLRAEDMTFQQVVDKVLKDHSRILLADPTLSIADIAERLGLNDSSGIYRRFRRWYGLTPEQVRQQLTS